MCQYQEPTPFQIVQFIGYQTDETTVTTEFTTDGIIDGTGPLADFQTFYFDERFSDLVKFEVSNYGYALDNLTVAVPEPSLANLLLVGACALYVFRRAKRSR